MKFSFQGLTNICKYAVTLLDNFPAKKSLFLTVLTALCVCYGYLVFQKKSWWISLREALPSMGQYRLPLQRGRENFAIIDKPFHNSPESQIFQFPPISHFTRADQTSFHSEALRIKGQVVTCSMVDCFLRLDEGQSDVSCKQKNEDTRFDIVPNAKSILQQLAKNCNLYLITQCQHDSTEEGLLHLLKKLGLFDQGLNPLQVLFCSTAMGKAHIARQLGSKLHVDSDLAVISALQPHVSMLFHVCPCTSVNLP